MFYLSLDFQFCISKLNLCFISKFNLENIENFETWNPELEFLKLKFLEKMNLFPGVEDLQKFRKHFSSLKFEIENFKEEEVNVSHLENETDLFEVHNPWKKTWEKNVSVLKNPGKMFKFRHFEMFNNLFRNLKFFKGFFTF